MDNNAATSTAPAALFTEVERPTGSSHHASELGDALMKTIETGKALRIPLSISKNKNAFTSRMQSLARHRGVTAHCRRADDDHMVVWFTKPETK